MIDDDDCIGYLNDWDRKIPNLDVVDDYRNEKKDKPFWINSSGSYTTGYHLNDGIKQPSSNL